MASSVFVRHTLNALYSDLHVQLKRVNVLGTPPHENMSVFIALAVKGTARVSGSPGEWDV